MNNVVMVSGEQQRDSAMHICVSILPKLPFCPGYHIKWHKVPYAIQEVVVGYPF